MQVAHESQMTVKWKKPMFMDVKEAFSLIKESKEQKFAFWELK